MFSAFQYFEVKQLSIGSFCYLMATTFLCLLYLDLDSPRDFGLDSPGVNSEIELWRSQIPDNWISFKVTDKLNKTDILQIFQQGLASVDMTDVSFKMECDTHKCFMHFYSQKNGGIGAANEAIQAMRKLAKAFV